MNHQKYLLVLAAAAFITDSTGHILIVKKVEGSHIDAGLWTVPGGKVDQDENILQAVRREVAEEVSIAIESCEWLGEDVFQHGDNGLWYHGQHFYCPLGKRPKVFLEVGSFTDYCWISRKELDDHEYHPNIKTRLIEVFDRME